MNTHVVKSMTRGEQEAATHHMIQIQTHLYTKIY